jgi:hypothetical protein
MAEKRDETTAPPAAPRLSARPVPSPLDVRNHIRAREAVKVMLDRQKKVFVARKTFSSHGLESARILVDGKYYDVNARQLAQIQEGALPEQVWGVEEVSQDTDEER